MTRLPPIVCGVDDGYVLPLRVMMESLAVAHDDCLDELRLFVLHSGLDDGLARLIRADARRLGLWLELRTVLAGRIRHPVSGWVSEAVYLRLAIGEALREETAVLYLDADVLVLGDLCPLLARELGGVPVAAVRDPQNPIIGQGIALPGWRELGLPAGREYFNSGVMLLDLAQCERLRLFEQARHFLTEHPESVTFWDQDALNWAVDDDWIRLERRWNTFALSSLSKREGFVHYAEPVSPLETLLADEGNAAVLHFAGPAKPWLPGYPAGVVHDLYLGFLHAVKEAGTDGLTR
ncbi:glycosyltransferase family 8 protein [Streptosporangium soli]|nr:glycosyltransferase family 8 protein [Streptosporangium sp. KLBMP 9127]